GGALSATTRWVARHRGSLLPAAIPGPCPFLPFSLGLAMHDFTEWPASAKALAGLFTILVVAALWSMLASSLFLLGTGLIRSFHGWPLMEWWTYWRFYGFEQPVVGIWLK